jgi:hypothetical protein
MVAGALAADGPVAGAKAAPEAGPEMAGNVGLGPGIVSLIDAGVRDLGRTLSSAEIHAVRAALLGVDPDRGIRARVPRDVIVGYVCAGHRADGVGASGRRALLASGEAGCAEGGSDTTSSQVRVVAATDHVNLTWRSPLCGPNDERLGPRFPVMGGAYAPTPVAERLAGLPCVAVSSGIVAGTTDDVRPTAFERKIVTALGYEAVSSELVPVVILAAHLGWRVAAAVIVV